MFQLVLLIISGVGFLGMLAMALFKIPAVAALPSGKGNNQLTVKKTAALLNTSKDVIKFSAVKTAKKTRQGVKSFVKEKITDKPKVDLSEDYWKKIRKS